MVAIRDAVMGSGVEVGLGVAVGIDVTVGPGVATGKEVEVGCGAVGIVTTPACTVASISGVGVVAGMGVVWTSVQAMMDRVIKAAKIRTTNFIYSLCTLLHFRGWRCPLQNHRLITLSGFDSASHSMSMGSMMSA